MKFFVHPSPISGIKVAVGPSLICGGLVGRLNSWSSCDPNPLLFVVAPVTVVPLNETQNGLLIGYMILIQQWQ